MSETNTEWLDVLVNGKIVQINSKGEYREVPKADKPNDSPSKRRPPSDGNRPPRKNVSRRVGRQRKTG